MADGTVFFDELVSAYETLGADEWPPLRDWITPHLPEHGGRAVDLGCGYGRFAPLLTPRFDHVLGIDISERSIARARATHAAPNTVFRAGGLLDVTPERDGRFDLVLSVNALHHLDDPVRAAAQVRDLVAPGGRAIVVDLHGSPHWGTPAWHVDKAFHDARQSYLHRSQNAAVAAELLRLFLSPTWLAHCYAHVPLEPGAFRRVYGDAFPGAAFHRVDNLDLVTAVTWQAPESPERPVVPVPSPQLRHLR